MESDCERALGAEYCRNKLDASAGNCEVERDGSGVRRIRKDLVDFGSVSALGIVVVSK